MEMVTEFEDVCYKRFEPLTVFKGHVHIAVDEEKLICSAPVQKVSSVRLFVAKVAKRMPA